MYYNSYQTVLVYSMNKIGKRVKLRKEYTKHRLINA